ncbi:multiple inositol polyphosphate phosphatase 1 [Bradysia coprophila]|uniref:multiple inositol polyphosphate phosphatase 1 n=1 Tax=Bradysia coprophila TaxID=38358 RepID=UPI00187D95AE|nr:multiple inositol polyphosphate phosphatase 1 [Bradysia coprophila]
MFRLLIISTVLVLCKCNESNAPQCFDSTKENLKLHLGTKTPYRFIFNRNDTAVTYQGCQPRRIWSVIRHGTRNPKRKVIYAINVHLANVRNHIIDQRNPKLCPHDLERLRNWRSQVNVDEEKHLTYEGSDELLQLAERIQNRFPSLLPEQYDQQLYKFKFTDSQRTLKSFESFASGLFGRNNLSKVVHLPPTAKDPILRFYKRCSKWTTDVDDNPDASYEPKQWLESEEMNRLLRDLREKLDFDALSIDDVILMYTTCTFETAWYKFDYSPWCSIFNEDQLKIIEFYYDLKHYWKDGYGFGINHQQACPALNDMLHHLELNSSKPNSTFYFTHSGTMLKLLAHLGLYKDDFSLTHKDFNKNRKWHLETIDAFASNLVFISFECATEPYVLAMHQEKVIHIPGCPTDKDLCSLATIKGTFEWSLNWCNFDEFCENPKINTA